MFHKHFASARTMICPKSAPTSLPASFSIRALSAKTFEPTHSGPASCLEHVYEYMLLSMVACAGGCREDECGH